MAARKDGSKKNALRAVTRRSLSPLQRYRMIAEMAYYRALERGFVGGNPVEDWLEAEKAIDDRYDWDFSKLLVTPHIAGLFKLVNKLLRRHGVAPIDVKTLVDRERKNVEALAHASKRAREPVKTAVSRQIQILMDASEMMLARFELLAQAGGLQGPFAAEHGRLLQALGERTLASLRESTDATMHTSVESLHLLLKARVVDTFSVLKSLAEGFGEQSSEVRVPPIGVTLSPLRVKQMLATAYATMPLRALATVPISALKGLNERDAQVLNETFGIRTLKDFAQSRHFNLALQIVTMAEVEVE